MKKLTKRQLKKKTQKLAKTPKHWSQLHGKRHKSGK